MPLNPVEMLPDHWADFPAPRQRRCDDPPLLQRLYLSLCAVLCGAEPCPEMEAFGQAKAAWFSPSLDLSRGLPSPDTVNCTGAVWDGSKAHGIWASQSRAERRWSVRSLPAPEVSVLQRAMRAPWGSEPGMHGGGERWPARSREAGPQGPRRCAAGPLAPDD